MSTLDLPSNEDIDPALAEFVTNDQFDDARTMVDEWQLIARRADLRVATDAVDFLLYLSDNNPCFPHKIVKRSKKGRRIRRKSRRFRVKGSAQTTINFKPSGASVCTSGVRDSVGPTCVASIATDPTPLDGDSLDPTSCDSDEEEGGSTDDKDDDLSTSCLGDDLSSLEARATEAVQCDPTPQTAEHINEASSEGESDDSHSSAPTTTTVRSISLAAPLLPSVPEEPVSQVAVRAATPVVCANPRAETSTAAAVDHRPQPSVPVDPLPTQRTPAKQHSVNMAAQTEWDFWGPIGPSDNVMRPKRM